MSFSTPAGGLPPLNPPTLNQPPIDTTSSNDSLPPFSGSGDGLATISTIASSHVNTPSEQSSQHNLHPRSCLTCRRRKVRCNKRTPCSNCVKAGIECIFPGPGRAPRKAKRPPDAELLSRLRRLEGVIEQLRGKNAPVTDTPSVPAPVAASTASAPTPRDDSETTNESQSTQSMRCPNFLDADPKRIVPRDLENEFGRLVIDEGRSRYVSNRLWASLGDEIEELQDILDPSSSEDEDYPSPDSSSSTHCGNHDGFLFGYYSLSHSLRKYHPPPATILLLWNVYGENVAPLVPVFHKPTVNRLIIEAARSLDTLEKHSEALIFAVYLTAVISLSPQQCLSRLGEDRDTLVSRYRFAVEQALSRANFLNTQSLMLLQVAVLFLIGVRREDDTKFVWSMNAIVLRIAQGLGLHRDGSNFGLKPLETELRRRLWWHICLLDIRSSEDHGTDAQIHERMYDTRLPLNINDEDISPEMQEPPKERVGCTDMTFCLIRCEITVGLRRVNYVCPSGRYLFGDVGPTIEDREKMIQIINKRIEERYIKFCDTTVPMHWVCATVARLILAKLWLVVHHPLTRHDRGASLSHASRESLLLTSIELLEFSRLLETNQHTAKWGWLFRTNMQWHGMAFVLSELCVRPVCPVTDRAWLAVQSIFGEWEKHATQKKGMLWRPLSRLMKRAADFRAKQEEELRAQFGPNPIPSKSAAPFPPVELGLGKESISSPCLPRIHVPVGSTPSVWNHPGETVQPQPRSSLDIDITKNPVDMFTELFPDTDWLADPGLLDSSTSQQPVEQPSTGVDTAARLAHSSIVPMDFEDDPSSSQLTWAEWDQVMRDFQRDVERTQANVPMGNFSDWLA